MAMNKAVRIVGVLMILCGGITMAQIASGTISGSVKDSTGAVLPSTQLVILNEETGLSRSVVTDVSGRYIASSLPVGNYRVTGTLAGFNSQVRSGIVLTVGREAVVDLTLEVGGLTQTVEVTGEAPLVESTSASLGNLVDQREIRALPLNGRSFDQLALVQPGVILNSPGSRTNYKYGTGKRFSVGGQRSTANSFLLDGTNISDHANGTPGGAAGTNLGVDTIREFKIFTNSYKAEYGRTTGSVTTAVSRTGTNTFHGTVFENIRNSVLDARNFFDVGSKPAFKRNQFGGVFGGPIKKDKLFFFGGYEGLREGLGTTTIATVPTESARRGILPGGIVVPVNPAIVPYVNLYPVPNGRDFGDGSAEFLQTPTFVTNEDNFMVRMDYQLNANTSIFGRYTFDDDELNQPQSIPPLVQIRRSRRQYSTLQVNSIFGPKALNNFRFAYNRSNALQDRGFTSDLGLEGFVPGEQLGTLQIGALSATGSRTITELGPDNGAGAEQWVFNVFQWSDDFSYVTGKHSLKTGVDIQRFRDNFQSGTSVRGTYTFDTFVDFLAGRPSDLTAQFPPGSPLYWGLRQTLFGVYVQDDYTVSPRLTLNLGLRWEATTDPIDVNGKMAILPSLEATSPVVSDHFFHIPKKSFEPRVGIAWRLDESGKTVLRTGGGIFHNQILPWFYFEKIASPPFFDRSSLGNPPFPNGFMELRPDGPGRTRLNRTAPVNKIPVTYQYNLSVQREVFRSTVLQLAYVGNKSSQVVTNRDIDVAIPTILPDGRKFFARGLSRRNPAFRGLRTIETDGSAVYNAFTVTLQRQSASGFHGQINYTFSKAMDEASGTNNTESTRAPKALLDPYDRARDWGLADFDARNAFVFNFSYPLPFRAGSNALGAVVNGWTISGIGTFTDGLPFTARLETSVARDLSSEFSERPDLKPGADQNPNHGTSIGCPGFATGTKLGGADHYFDPCSFSLPLEGTYGNLGRNTIIGPGLANVDLSVEKTFAMSEATSVAFRAEVFNIFNRVNFGLPNTSPLASTGDANRSVGRITDTITSSRQIQFALRISF